MTAITSTTNIPSDTTQINQANTNGKYAYGKIARNARTIAIGAAALLALAALPSAEGGPVAYGLCMVECLALTLGGFIPACIVVCTPALLAPTP